MVVVIVVGSKGRGGVGEGGWKTGRNEKEKRGEGEVMRGLLEK